MLVSPAAGSRASAGTPHKIPARLRRVLTRFWPGPAHVGVGGRERKIRCAWKRLGPCATRGGGQSPQRAATEAPQTLCAMERGARRRWTMLVLLPASALAQTLTATNFVKYFDYDGMWAVRETVAVATTGTTQTLDMTLSGVDNYCAIYHEPTDPNVRHPHPLRHMREAGLGGHYYSEGTFTDDPWVGIRYGGWGSTSGSHSGTTSVDTGLISSDLEGRALIVHDYDGKRIACALLAAPTPAPSSSPTAPTLKPSPAPTPVPVVVDWKRQMDPQTLSVPAGTTVTFTWSGVVHDVHEDVRRGSI